jgi:hypothetical protein
MPRLHLFSALAFTAFAAGPARASAQTRPVVTHSEGRSLDDVKIGSTLRIAMQGDDIAAPLRGKLQGFGETSVLLDVNGARRELPMSSILLIEESYRDRKRGALVGVIAAAVGVYVWDFFGPHPRYKDQDKRYRENVQALAASMSAGIAIGAGIGWHRWRIVSHR